MSEPKDKYTMEGDDMSQVRTIIKRLNEEAPGKEKSREVVVRADGTKVIRVTKKRRVMVTAREKRARVRKWVVMIVLILLLGAGALGAFYAYRMSMMSGEQYLLQQVESLKKTWGVSELTCGNAQIDGLELKVESIVAEFPADSMIEKVEISGISATLSPLTFLTGKITADVLDVRQAAMQLRSRDGRMQMPLQQGGDLWNFNRISCRDFDVTVMTEESTIPLIELTGADSYLYYPRADRRTSSLRIMGGKLMVKGWKTMDVKEGKVLLSSNGIEDFSLRSNFAGAKTDDGSFLSINGKIDNGASLAGPFPLVSNRIALSEFTGGRFAQILTAKTVASAGHSGAKASILLPLGQEERPKFEGEFDLTDVAVVGMPALGVIRKHLERDKRRMYLPVKIMKGKVTLSQKEGTTTLTMVEGDMMDAETVTLRGEVSVDKANSLSGKLDYGIPDVLATREYVDGRPDPVFQQQGSWCWLNTRLTGSASSPGDDAREQEARAEGDRIGRERLNLDEVDLDVLIQETREENKKAPGIAPSDGATPDAGRNTGVIGEGRQEGWSSDPWQEAAPQNKTSQDSPVSPGTSAGTGLPENPFGK